jgi:hypothetical protein
MINLVFKKLIILLVLIYSTCLTQVQVSYQPSDEIFINPERGFYTQLTSYDTQSPITLSSLNNIKSQGKSLILRMYYLKSFRSVPLNQSILTMIGNDFNTIRQAGMKSIVRFAYSDNIGQPDAPLNIILNHIDQLKPLLQQNSDVILVMQAGFIGAWGEWHSSTNGLDTVTNRRTILFKLLDALPSDRMVQVRTPHFKQEIFENHNPIPPDSAFLETYYTRTGHHNDCFLASWDDYGTYTDTTIEKQYLSDDCLFVPMGGETCNPSQYSGCDNAVYQMRHLRWSYLNSTYHPTVLNGWTVNGCMDDIKRNLGYRFELIDGSYTDSLRPGDTFSFSLSLINSGNAPLFNPRNVELILVENNSNQKYFCELPIDPKLWKPNDTTQLHFDIGIMNNHTVGNYKLYLNLPDPDEKIHQVASYSVRFANLNVWDSNSGYNDLNLNLTVNSSSNGTPYTGSLFFTPMTINAIDDYHQSGQDINQLDELRLKNYPNPFNNSTKILFKVGKDSNITLKLFNLLGEQLDTLINDYRLKGTYEINYDATKLASGIYFCILSSEKSSIASKIIVMK